MIEAITNNWLIGAILFLVIFIAFAELLFWLASKDNVIMYWLVYGFFYILAPILTLLSLAKNIDGITLILNLLVIVYSIFIGMTLYEQAGYKDRKWYYLTFLFSPLAFVYQFVKK